MEILETAVETLTEVVVALITLAVKINFLNFEIILKLKKKYIVFFISSKDAEEAMVAASNEITVTVEISTVVVWAIVV